MKKRFILILLIMIAILAISFSFAAYNLGYGSTGTTHTCTPSWRYTKDGTSHWKMCTASNCGRIAVAKAVHTDGTSTNGGKCVTCGYPYVTQVQHTCTPSSTYTKDGTSHWKMCTASNCGRIAVAKAAHNGGTATNGGECATCGYPYVRQTVPPMHTCVSTSYETDGTYHWKICIICAKMIGIKAQHTLIYESTDNKYHWTKCTICSELGGMTAHTGGTSTNGGKCENCKYSYVEQQHRCVPEMGYSTDSDFHWKGCATLSCDRIVGVKAPHTAGTSTNGGACDVCGMVYVKQVVAPHICMSPDHYAASDQYHWKVCTVPGCQKLVMKETAHNGGTSTNGGKCEACGQPYVEQAIAHECVAGAPENWDYNGWNVNSESHFLNCKECGKEMNGTYHHGTLPKNGKYICADCGYPFAPATCLHDDAELVKFDDYSHFMLCKDCGMVLDSNMPHSFISAVEGDYCPCGYTIPHVCVSASTYSKDARYHWKVCIGANCKQILEYARNHSGGTTTNGGACEVCGYPYVEQTPMHKCTASAEYKADAYFHWKSCAGCGETVMRGYHIGGTLSNGGKCMICKMAYPVNR